MSDLPDLLFNEHDLGTVLADSLKKAGRYVDEIPENYFISNSDETIFQHVLSKFRVLPLELHESAKEMEKEEIKIDGRADFDRAIFNKNRPFMIPGLKITISIPYSGDTILWKCQPSQYTLSPPRAKVVSSNEEAGHIYIILRMASDRINNEKIKQEIERTIGEITSYRETIKRDVESHNQQLSPHIQKCIATRRQRIGKYDYLIKDLDIPLKKKPGAPDVSSLPIKRRNIKPLAASPDKPQQYAVRDEDYNHILSVIRHEGCSFEATPRTFAKHDEEELRDIILAHLNGHYQGDATGEAFRKMGKTDIRIEYQNRAAFVGECKVWRGAKELGEAVDQLLSYLTWRDCKAALILFNKEVAGFSAIQAKVPEVLREHGKYISQEDAGQSGEFRFRFRSAEDVDRQIIIHVFLFNLYVPRTEAI